MAKKIPKKAAKKTVDQRRAKLEKELREAIKEVDEEGLLFLLQQAGVLIHNARVERINKVASEIRGSRKASAPQAAGVEIEESDGGKVFFLTIGQSRKVLNLEELKRLVRICYAAETKSDALRQLYTVLSRERRDILSDAHIGGPQSPLIDGLFQAIRAKFKLEDK
ncbi:MAG: hypothetical protein ABSG38_11755 [Spirochaetia bacterium]|jgi:hypothetical protein